MTDTQSSEQGGGWTEEKPKEAGWYWCKRNDKNSFAGIVRIPEFSLGTIMDGYLWSAKLEPPTEAPK